MCAAGRQFSQELWETAESTRLSNMIIFLTPSSLCNTSVQQPPPALFLHPGFTILTASLWFRSGRR
jgi:hypothetical protein